MGIDLYRFKGWDEYLGFPGHPLEKKTFTGILDMNIENNVFSFQRSYISNPEEKIFGIGKLIPYPGYNNFVFFEFAPNTEEIVRFYNFKSELCTGYSGTYKGGRMPWPCSFGSRINIDHAIVKIQKYDGLGNLAKILVTKRS